MVNAVPEPIILPVIFNDEFIVDAPETNKLVKFVLFNNDVDVAFKLLIDKVDAADKLVKSVLNVSVERFKVDIDVLILFIEKVDDDDILFKFVFVAYTVKSGLFIIVEFQSD